MSLSAHKEADGGEAEGSQLSLSQLEGKIVKKFFFKTNTLFLITEAGNTYFSDHRVNSIYTSWDCEKPRVIHTARMDTEMKSFERLCADIEQSNPGEDDYETMLKITFKKKADKDKFGLEHDFLFCTLRKVTPPRRFIGFTKLI